MQALEAINYQSREVIQTLKATVAKDATDAQLAQFIEVCKATGLNPFLREIWCIAKTNTIMTSRDGYLAIANRHPAFDGIQTEVVREGKKIVKAICTVWRKDRAHPVICEAWFDEYVKPNSNVWQTYPSAMIMKVAEALALKRSFAISGLVTQEEIESTMEGELHKPQPKPRDLTPIEAEVVAIDPSEEETIIEEPKRVPPKDLSEDLAALKEGRKPKSLELLEQLKASIERLAKKQNVTPDIATQKVFEDQTGKMTFDKIDKLKTPAQLEKARLAIIKTTTMLLEM